MKGIWIKILLLTTLLYAPVTGMCAGAPPDGFKTFLQKFLPRKAGQVSAERLIINQASRQAMQAVAYSKVSNMEGLQNTQALLRPVIPSPTTFKPLLPILPPNGMRKAVFTLQYNPEAHGKGSAFAVLIDGQLWGVTARHVLDDIGRSPFMAVTTRSGQVKMHQINALQEGNIRGADIAIFRIPSNMTAYLTPLQPDYELPQPHTLAQSAGFSQGYFTWFEQVEILFSSHHRLLTRYKTLSARSGYCGSPVLVNGKVVGVHVAISLNSATDKAEWKEILSAADKEPLPDFNHIVPIEWVRQLVRQTQHPREPRGVMMQIFGHDIGRLAPDEFVQSIQQLRNGHLYKTLNEYPFMDYRRLERFFEVEPNDVLRVIVQKGDRSSSRKQIFWYEWDVASGTLTRQER